MAVNLSKEPLKKLPEYTPVHLITEEESMQSHSLPEYTPVHLIGEQHPIQQADPMTAEKEKPSKFAALKDFISSIDDEWIALGVFLLIVILLTVLVVVVLQPLTGNLLAESGLTADEVESLELSIDSLIQICKKGVLFVVVFAAVGFAIASIGKLLR